jgi:hypothetical protein
MRIERLASACGLAVAMAVSGCGSILQAPGPDGGPDSGHDGGGTACSTLDESACSARTDCAVGRCASICGAGSSFVRCYDPATEGPPPCPGIAAPCPPPVVCSLLTDETSCQARSDCQPNYCPNCNGGSSFVGCSAVGTGGSLCPAIACPLPCSQVTTRDGCDARPDCHPVFVDDRTCGCAAAGCCAHFSRCADGATALCKAPAIACDAVTPYCAGPYVVGYTPGCYEGCVLATDCAAN